MRTLLKRLFFGSFKNEPSARSLDFFKQHPCSYVQLEFFIHTLKGKGNLQEELMGLVENAVFLGMRMKMCLRVRLHPTPQNLSIVEMMFTSSQLSSETTEVLNRYKSGDSRKLIRENEIEYRNLQIKISRIQSNLRMLVVELVKKADIEDVVMEDTDYNYNTIITPANLNQIKQLVSKGDFPVWIFLCTSDTLCSNRPKVSASCL